MKKTIMVCVLAIIMVILCGCADGKTTAKRKENEWTIKTAAQMIIDASDFFKAPQSVRLVSGTANLIETEGTKKVTGLFYARLSGENSYGANTTTDYILFYGQDGSIIIATEKDAPDRFKDTSYFTGRDIDVGAINKIVADYWKNRGL